MSKFFRYKDDKHDIKLISKVHEGMTYHKPIEGLNTYSREWYRKLVLRNEDTWSSNWTHVIPFTSKGPRFNAIAKHPKNKPCI